jgi:ribonuclease HI
MNISEILKLLAQEKSIDEISLSLKISKSEIKKVILELADKYFVSQNDVTIIKNADSDGLVNVYTDGAVSGNPGPGGIGVAIYNSAGEEIAYGKKFIGNSTNNEAEYKALIFSLDILDDMTGIKNICFYTDSELMAKQIQGKYKVSSPNVFKHYVEFFKRIKKYGSYKIEHVRREKNQRADELAVLGKLQLKQDK